MSQFFPSAERVLEARRSLANGHYGDLDKTMGTSSLAQPYGRDIPALIREFCDLVDEIGLREDGSTGFVVLVPVAVRGTSLTTPVLVDVEHCELVFTSHPELGAGAIPSDVLSENPDLARAVREQLLGVLATWHNPGAAEDE
jgi:hypothetical protein